MSSFSAIFKARRIELTRDPTTWIWSLVFPIVLVVGIATLIDDKPDVFRIGVLGVDNTGLSELQATDYIRFIHYSERDEARRKLRAQKIDLLVQGGTPPSYWINEASPQGYMLERMLVNEADGRAWQRATVDGPAQRYLDFVMPGVLAVNIMYGALFGVGYMLIRQRQAGVLKRLSATPLGAFRFLAAQVLVRLALLAVVTAVLFVAMHWIYEIPMYGSWWLLALFDLVGCLAMISMGVLMASRATSQEAAGGLLNLLTWPMVFLSGVWFSMEGAPAPLYWLSQIFPLTHLLEGTRAIMLEGVGLAEVRTELAALLAMTLVFLLVGALRFKWQEQHDPPKEPKPVPAADAPKPSIPARALFLRIPLTVIVLSLTAVFGWGIKEDFKLDTSALSSLDQDDPTLVALDRFHRQFGSDDAVLLAYRAKDGDIFSAQSLAAVQELTRRLEAGIEVETLPDDPGSVMVEVAKQLGHIRRVQSLTTLRIQSADGDTLASRRLVPDSVPSDPAALAGIRRTAMAEADWPGRFFSADGAYGLIVVRSDHAAQPPADYVPPIDAGGVRLDDAFLDFEAPLTADPRAEVEEIRYQRPDNQAYAWYFKALEGVYAPYTEVLEFHPVGYAPLTAFVQQVIAQSSVLNLALLVIVGVLLWLLFGSLSAVVWPILLVVLALVWTIGGASLMGVRFSGMLPLTVMLIFVVGIANCVHVLSAYLNRRRDSVPPLPALQQAYDRTGRAITLASLTTMAGMAALAFSDLTTLRVFAATSAAGVGLTLVFSYIALPIMLAWWPPARAEDGDWRLRLAGLLPAGNPALRWGLVLLALATLWWLGGEYAPFLLLIAACAWLVIARGQGLLNALPLVLEAHAGKVLAGFAAVLLALGYGTSQVRIDSNILELLRDDNPIRAHYQVVDDHLVGTQNMEVVIDTGRGDGVLEPALFQAIVSLQSELETRWPERIKGTWSIADVMQDTNQIMHGDDPAWHRVPESGPLLAQLLRLYASANPEERRALVSDDYAQAHISIAVRNAGSSQYQQFFAEIEPLIDARFAPLKAQYPALDVTLTGSIPLVLRNADAIAEAQYQGFAIALAVISIILILALGSVKAGLLSVIPNLLPALTAFGLMGLLGIPLDTDTLLIAPIIIGIAVDDTIHFMTHYRQALERGLELSAALRETLREVGQAVMFTSLIFGLGFAVLAYSDYLGTARIGVFGSLGILMALLCDLLLLPALILIFKPRPGLDKVTAPLTAEVQAT